MKEKTIIAAAEKTNEIKNALFIRSYERPFSGRAMNTTTAENAIVNASTLIMRPSSSVIDEIWIAPFRFLRLKNSQRSRPMLSSNPELVIPLTLKYIFSTVE
jgi:hypothetical protein